MSSEVKENTIPAGYWKDSRGVLTPESLVKPVDKERDALVRCGLSVQVVMVMRLNSG